MQATRMPRILVNFLASELICRASSLAGASTIPTGPSLSPSGGWSYSQIPYIHTYYLVLLPTRKLQKRVNDSTCMCLNMGSRKASVLPEPVFATPMTSLVAPAYIHTHTYTYRRHNTLFKPVLDMQSNVMVWLRWVRLTLHQRICCKRHW